MVHNHNNQDFLLTLPDSRHLQQITATIITHLIIIFQLVFCNMKMKLL